MTIVGNHSIEQVETDTKFYTVIIMYRRTDSEGTHNDIIYKTLCLFVNLVEVLQIVEGRFPTSVTSPGKTARALARERVN